MQLPVVVDDVSRHRYHRGFWAPTRGIRLPDDRRDHGARCDALHLALPEGHTFSGETALRLWEGVEAREDIIRQIKGGGSKGLAEIDSSFYDTKSQFGEDAMNCWKSRNRPQDSCDDYESSSKRLLPDTAKDRKELGLTSLKDAPGPKNYLCHFCPIHSKVVQRKRQLLGLYDDK